MRKVESWDTEAEQNQEDIKPEKAVAILRNHGMEVTTEQARVILAFLQQMADIAVAQYLRQ